MAPTDTLLTPPAPAPPPQVQQSAAEQALRAVEILAIERAAIRALTIPLRTQLVAIQRDAMRRWIAAFGATNRSGDPLAAAGIAAAVLGQLGQVRAPGPDVLDAYVRQALELGVRQAARMVESALPAGMTASAVTTDTVGAVPDAVTSRIVAGLPNVVASAIGDAETAVAAIDGSSFEQLDTALARAHRAVPKTSTTVVSAVNGASNAGKTAVAQWVGADMLWLAEPDCCTTCAGLAGRTTSAGQPFDPRWLATFTDKPRVWPPGPLEHPPCHPSCRCELVPWFGSATSGFDLPAALQREARRAILRGWSLPSESGAERIRAAAKLLARHPAAPKTVTSYARRAVAAGRFPTRAVPVHTPRPRPHVSTASKRTPRRAAP